jgi:hypothetical protein
VFTLRGEGHLPDVPAPHREEPLDLGERGVAQERGVVGAAPGFGQPRTLEVDAVDEPVVGDLGEDRDAALEVGRAHRHQAGQQARRTARVLVLGGASGSRVVEVGEGRAATAVAMHVDVCRQHRAADPLGCVGARECCVAPLVAVADRRDGGDAVTLDAHEHVGQHGVVDKGRSEERGVHCPHSVAPPAGGGLSAARVAPSARRARA